MSEAIIIYRGRGGGVDPELLKPQVITNNGTYVAPVTGTYWVAAVGGGGGGGGGCRNSRNSSQVFYGAGGTRGTLNYTSVNLNAGDSITYNLGAGGAGGTNNTTVVSNNSRGTNGGTGGTSTFGSYASGSGGTYGSYAWSRHSWSNVNKGWVNSPTWNNVIIGWNNTKIPSYTTSNNMGWHLIQYTTTYYCGGIVRTNTGSSQYSSYYYCNVCGNLGLTWLATAPLTTTTPPNGNTSGQWNNVPIWSNTVTWNNRVVWNNTLTNYTTGCYTSIQQGTWWYTNTNNQVTTSGTRTYRGDGGASGKVGNAGFIVIKPPTV